MQTTLCDNDSSRLQTVSSAVIATRYVDKLYRPLLGLFLVIATALAVRQWVAAPNDEGFFAVLLWVQRDVLSLGLLTLSLALLGWQLVFALRYRPYQAVEDQRLPKVSVVIPAFNEGAQVLNTVHSVMASRYPLHRLEVICIDDGSMDDTWDWMIRAKTKYPHAVTLIKQPENRGKRHALLAGFQRATGDVVVTVDSDSELLENTLREMVYPFVHDSRVGSVAGNVRVLNIDEGAIPKMLEVSFTSAFDFIRAGQSVYGGVFCTPGALSAYRSNLLHKVLDTWMEQTFRGNAATIGEDRALTNLVIAEGYRVVYQRDAVVMTKVPTNFHTLRKMLTRWARSNVRENLVLLTFMHKNFRHHDNGGNWVRVFSATQMIRMALFEALKIALLFALVTQPMTSLLAISLGCCFAAIIPGTVYRLRYGTNFGYQWALPFAFFWLFCLAWIPLYGMFTAGNTGWLTRGKPTVSEPTAIEKAEKLPIAA